MRQLQERSSRRTRESIAGHLDAGFCEHIDLQRQAGEDPGIRPEYLHPRAYSGRNRR